MSAMLAITMPDQAFLMADAAVYDRDGILTNIRSKTVLLPELKAAFSCRGNLTPLSLLTMAAEDFASWDEFRAAAPGVFQAVDALMTAMAPGRIYEILMLGWSDDRNRAEVLFFANHDQKPEGWHQDGPTLITDCVLPFGPGLEVNGDTFDPRVDGIAAFERSRRTVTDIRYGQGNEPLMAFAVGGFVECATVSAAGVRSEVLHRWPDEVGRPIHPADKAEEYLERAA